MHTVKAYKADKTEIISDTANSNVIYLKSYISTETLEILKEHNLQMASLRNFRVTAWNSFIVYV